MALFISLALALASSFLLHLLGWYLSKILQVSGVRHIMSMLYCMLTTLLSLHQSLLSPQYHPSPLPTLAAPSSHHAFISLNEFVPFLLFCSTPSQCFPSLLPKGPVYIFCLLSINESIYGIDFLPLLVTWGWMLMFVFEKSYSPS